MCCSRTPSRRSLYNALKTIDPTLPPEDQFWHGAGRRGRSADTTTSDAATAIDAAWLAITDTDRWDALTPEERLAATTTWIQSRTDLLDEGLGESGIEALNRYTDRLVKRAHSRDQRRTWTRRGLMTAAATALITIGLMAGSTQPHTDANAESLFTHPTATQSQTVDAVSVRALDGTVKTTGGKSVVYTSKARCDTGKVVKAKKSQTVTWQWKNGNVGKKKVKKGQQVCRVVTTAQPGKSTQTPTGLSKDVKVNASGEVTGFAAPKGGATPEWISSLGLDGPNPPKMSWNADPLPMPALVSKASPATKIHPVGVVSVTPSDSDGYVRATTEWAVEGGSGVLTVKGTDYVLNPRGTTIITVTDNVPLFGAGYYGGSAAVSGQLRDDHGQAGIPSDFTANWNLDSSRVIAVNADGANPVGADGAGYSIDSRSGTPVIHWDVPS